MKINQNTFCSAPWFSVRNDNQGEYRACCVIEQNLTEFKGNTKYYLDQPLEEWTNSEYMKYVRENLSNGVRLKECRTCWKKESVGVKSLRQKMNDTVTDNMGNQLENTWIANYFKNKNDYCFDLMLAADIKVENVCNFECLMCNPADSSLIYNKWLLSQQNEFVSDVIKEKKNYFSIIKKTYNEHNGIQLLDKALDSPLKFLKVLGGEPLLNKKMLTKLKNLPEEKKKKISLTFVTNGSVNLLNTAKELGNFKNIQFVISLDAVGELQEYIRVNSNWQTIESNITQFLQNKSSLANCVTLSLVCVVQALNVKYYYQLHNWAESKNIDLDVTVLLTPEYLNFNTLVPMQKEKILKSFDHFRNNQNIELIKKHLADSTYDSKQQEKFARFIKWHDPDLNLLKIDPDWSVYFD